MEIQSVNYYSFRSREVAEVGAKAVEEGPNATVLEENAVSAKHLYFLFLFYKKFSLQYQGSIITVTRHDGVLVSQSSAVDDLESSDESSILSSPPPSLPVNDPYTPLQSSGSINDTRETG